MDTLEKEIHKVTVHRFKLGDVEDPEIYAAEPLYLWSKTEAGKFVMDNAVNIPTYHSYPDPVGYGFQFDIVAELESKKLSEFYLRWGKHGSQ